MILHKYVGNYFIWDFVLKKISCISYHIPCTTYRSIMRINYVYRDILYLKKKIFPLLHENVLYMKYSKKLKLFVNIVISIINHINIISIYYKY